VIAQRPHCLFCGVELSLLPSSTASPPSTPPSGGLPAPAAHAYLFFDPTGLDAERLASVVSCSVFEASQRLLRGGWQLWRGLTEATAALEAHRLAREGLRVQLLAAGDVDAAPWIARGGHRQGRSLILHGSQEDRSVQGSEVLLAVLGTVTRAQQSSDRPRKIDVARPSDGYRIHLHLAEPPAHELDPEEFCFDGARDSASSLAELRLWIRELGCPIDLDFRQETPALAPVAAAAQGSSSPLGMVRGLEEGREALGEARVVLDNLAQFRFYSACRGALARKLR